MTLNTKLDNVKEYVTFPAVPDYISDNLGYELREYQTEAISRFLFYYGNYSGEKSPHLLWQMATGSGKTLIMAALILEMYEQGYRNFWFFVTSKDIITKTIDNFIDSSSRKYQFAETIEIDGQRVEIRQVENFVESVPDAINIKFSTINILHQISQPEMLSENSVSLDDFCEVPIILIADEAHHLNAATKKEETNESTWENSVKLVLQAHPKNRLFEFTATANLTNKNIAQKYENKLLYNYDLRHFRNDKYSKDVFTFSTDGDIDSIMLRAILISQYRKNIAADNGIFLKPVILFTSKTVATNKENFENLNKFILGLSADSIKKEFNNLKVDDDIWDKTTKYFARKEEYLCESIKIDFSVDTKKILLHDGTNARIPEQPKLLVTLENEDNPVRAIFSVKMLQEGWDVLNLFDIVRLYDTRDGNWNKDGKYIPGNGTVSESQLIGRGARYFPFKYGIEDKYKRKFDDNENEQLRAIEQMHYHCKHNPSYITEIRLVLKDSGILADDLLTIALKMKQDFIDGEFKNFQSKNVYVNKKIDKMDLNFENIEFVENEIIEQKVPMFPDFSNDESLEISMDTGFSHSQSLIANRLELQETLSKDTINGVLSDVVPQNIMRHVLNINKNFYFNNLKKTYPELKSMSQFMEKLGKMRVKIVATRTKLNNLFAADKVHICKEVLNSLEPNIKEERKRVIVSKHFYPQNAGESFQREIVRKTKKEDIEVGKSQKDSAKYKLNLSETNWYVYEDNFGTSEEKSFVKWFSDNMMSQKQNGKTELEENGWTEIFLVRNEKAVKLYSWFQDNLGEGFEPDFVLFMKRDEIEYVFYIEPKGNWSYDAVNKNFGKEQWKEDFLLVLKSIAETQQTKINQTNNWRLIGLPFYNENNSKQHFATEFLEHISL